MHYYRNHQEQCGPAVRFPYPGHCAKFSVKVLNAGVGFGQLGDIKQCQNRAGKNLHNQEEKRDTTKEMMPVRLFNFHKLANLLWWPAFYPGALHELRERSVTP